MGPIVYNLNERLGVKLFISMWLILLLHLMNGMRSLVQAEDGPGLGTDALPNEYAIGKLLSRINHKVGVHSGTGFVFMHRGYLIVPYAEDSGGGDGSGGLAV